MQVTNTTNSDIHVQNRHRPKPFRNQFGLKSPDYQIKVKISNKRAKFAKINEKFKEGLNIQSVWLFYGHYCELHMDICSWQVASCVKLETYVIIELPG